MSLDLSGKAGVAYATATITAPAGFVSTIFNATEADSSNQYVAKVDTTAGNVDLSTLAAPSTLAFLRDGDTVTFIKATTDANRVIVDDLTPGANFNGFSGVVYNYVNQQGESITLLADVSNDKWGVAI
jgi:hypothetical protein